MTDDERTNALRFDPAAYAIACARMKSAPLELTEHDFDQLSIISKSLETDARDAVHLAQLAIVHANAEKSAPVQTKAAPAVKAPVALKDWVNKDGTRTVTYKKLDACLDQIFDVLRQVLNKERDRVKALEQRITEQDARILELEAHAAAARTVQHADR